MSLGPREQVEHEARRTRALERIRRAERKRLSIANGPVRLEMNYIGALTLLGRIAQHLPAGDEDRYGLDKAMRDGNNWLLVQEKDLVFMKDSRGGYSPFERSAIKRTQEAGR